MSTWAFPEVNKQASRAMKQSDLKSMSIEELWTVHEAVADVLTAKITAEKLELEKRLHQISRFSEVRSSDALRPRRDRRPYPRVLPKYRNPLKASETWSGRGKKPRWLTKQLKSGRKMDDFRIGQDELRKLQGNQSLAL
jgi:DNA-binding protein H-NS